MKKYSLWKIKQLVDDMIRLVVLELVTMKPSASFNNGTKRKVQYTAKNSFSVQRFLACTVHGGIVPFLSGVLKHSRGAIARRKAIFKYFSSFYFLIPIL